MDVQCTDNSRNNLSEENQHFCSLVCVWFDNKAFNLSMCFLPQAALQAGLGRTVSSAVTAVMAASVTPLPATVHAVWAGLVHTAIKVTALRLLSCFLMQSGLFFPPASA